MTRLEGSFSIILILNNRYIESGIQEGAHLIGEVPPKNPQEYFINP